jgi:hypothetical protein
MYLSMSYVQRLLQRLKIRLLNQLPPRVSLECTAVKPMQSLVSSLPSFPGTRTECNAHGISYNHT